MSTSALAAAIIAGMLLLGAAAFSFHAALNTAFQRGHSAGGAEARLRYDDEFERRRRAAAAALEQSQRDVAALESERDELREQFDDLLEKIGRSAGSGSVCLDADVVRALDRLGRGAAPPSGGP